MGEIFYRRDDFLCSIFDAAQSFTRAHSNNDICNETGGSVPYVFAAMAAKQTEACLNMYKKN